jgi:AraC-like DNA-binding protein
MNTRLNQKPNWPELARQANGSVAKLAKLCGVSVRTLERYFLKNMGKKPKTWLVEQRQKQAIQLLRNGASVKVTASLLGYRFAHHFSREFRNYWGCCPTTQRASVERMAGVGVRRV